VTANCDLTSVSVARAATTAPRDYSDRLDFRLPPFLRMSWATAAARDRWSGVLNRLVDEVRTSEWLSVAAGLRLAAIVAVPRARASALAHEWSSRGLRSRVLSRDDAMHVRVLNGKMPDLAPGDEVHLLARSERMEELEALWRSADLVRMAAGLGYPPCCAAFTRTVAVERRCLDTIWAMVGGQSHEENGAQIAEIDRSPINPLLSALGLRATPHRPCGFHCQETQRLAIAYGDLRAKAAAQPDQEGLAEVLGWPVEWSTLHGIIEVRLPVFKICYEGDATAGCYKLRLTGGALPEHAAKGLEFPNLLPERPRVPTEAGEVE
jgi:hypothetical protein